MHTIQLPQCSLGGGDLFFIAGPCVIESAAATLTAAATVKKVADEYGLPAIFKSSYDKANRTSHTSYRGPGLQEGLQVLQEVRQQYGLPVTADVHGVEEVAAAAEVLDIIQIPAFLCRQTDLLLEAAATGKPVNVKKGQFLSATDMAHVAAKIQARGNQQIILTERGTTFGYHNLVVDMRSLQIMRQYGLVVFDATHSVQLPGGAGQCSSGERGFVGTLARAAVAAGVDGIFLEIHENPDCALCDGPNSIGFDELERLLGVLLKIHRAVKWQDSP
ncbi:MAG: 3-deoxy-8-phosphooctulonate synthase [Deltaproteobacteria bacterium]|nr:3-deoxy-8-phosphooctulonate synthase [Deltaproteobacteria bacterium]MBW2070502.1 3-deoxy-8-phosphooctulonate synthase [Deltaproteobacteria bacterium]